MKSLIQLQSAHVTQYTTTKGKSLWNIRENETNEDLHQLPGHLSEAEVFNIINFARKFELTAFNTGVQLGKKKTVTVYDNIIELLNSKLQLATEENVRLATALEKHIISEE